MGGITSSIKYYSLEPVQNDGTEETILYRVSGLPAEDDCVVGYAGIGIDQKKKWLLAWHRSGKRVPIGDVLYENPTEALTAVAEFIIVTDAVETRQDRTAVVLRQYAAASKLYAFSVGELERQRAKGNRDECDRLYDAVEEAHVECERLRKELAGISEIPFWD